MTGRRSRASDRCVLCGSTEALTREDVFSSWARKALAQAAAAGGLDTSQLPPRVVMPMCEGHNAACSQFERSVAPILKPAILGKTVEISPAAQLSIACWAFMKDVEYELIRPQVWENAVPRDKTKAELAAQRRRLRTLLETARPPVGYSLRLGMVDPTRKDTERTDREFVPAWFRQGRTQLSSVHPIGALVAEGVIDGSPAMVEAFHRATADDRRLVRIWPQRPQSLQVPRTRMSVADVERLRVDWGHADGNKVGQTFLVFEGDDNP